MDKFLLQQQVLERLAGDLLQAEDAMRAAHETATHEENVAENKYDTLGLEAAYLATCCVPCDHIPTRSWPLIHARDVMREAIAAMKAEQPV